MFNWLRNTKKEKGNGGTMVNRRVDRFEACPLDVLYIPEEECLHIAFQNTTNNHIFVYPIGLDIVSSDEGYPDLPRITSFEDLKNYLFSFVVTANDTGDTWYSAATIVSHREKQKA